MFLDIVSIGMGKALKGKRKRFAKVWVVGGEMDKSTDRRVCRVVSLVFSTALNDSLTWPWTTRHSQAQNERGGELGRPPEESVTDHACQMEEKRFAHSGRVHRGENLEDHDLGYLRWRGSGHEGTSIYSGMKNYDMVAEQKRVEHEDGPTL